MPDRTGEPRPGRDEPPIDLDAPIPAVGPTRAELRAIAIRACHLCDTDGYRGHTVCDHTDHAPAAQRGIALIRAALARSGTTTPEDTKK